MSLFRGADKLAVGCGMEGHSAGQPGDSRGWGGAAAGLAVVRGPRAVGGGVVCGQDSESQAA